MTDDLVKRLRELTCNCYDAEVIEAGKDAMDEAADRIEKLEATAAMWKGIHEGAVLAMQGHIKELEAALDDVAGYLARADWYYLKPETRKALGEPK